MPFGQKVSLNMADDTNRGFLKLFDPDGNEVAASWEDLLKVEAQEEHIDWYRQLVGNRSGLYWLISDRPGFIAQILEISIFHCHPRETNTEWQLGWCTNGIASYPHWDLESALNILRGHANWPPDNNGLPANVEALAREHVAYRLGKDPVPSPGERMGVSVLDAVDMRAALSQITHADPTTLLRLSGRKVPIFELMLAVSMFCGEADLDGREMEIVSAIVPEEQHERLAELAEMLAEQLGSE
jgi:hypothetical protein